MKSKEQVLKEITNSNDKDSWSISNGMDFFDGYASSVLEAMDINAKQECIEFANFIKDNNYTKGDKGWYQYFRKIQEFKNFSMSMPVYNFISTEQLYYLFLEQYK